MGSEVIFQIGKERFAALYNCNSHETEKPEQVFVDVVKQHPDSPEDILRELLSKRYETASGLHKAGEFMFRLVHSFDQGNYRFKLGKSSFEIKPFHTYTAEINYDGKVSISVYTQWPSGSAGRHHIHFPEIKEDKCDHYWRYQEEDDADWDFRRG